MISILICDNNPIFADYLKQEVAQLVTVPCRITVCHSSEELREYCKTNSQSSHHASFPCPLLFRTCRNTLPRGKRKRRTP